MKCDKLYLLQNTLFSGFVQRRPAWIFKKSNT